MHKLLIAVFFVLIVVILSQETPGELHDGCVTVRDCRSFGYLCSANRTCQCSGLYIPNAKRKKCVGGVDQKCKYDEHCIEGAYCQNQAQCRCKDEYYASSDGLFCSEEDLKKSFSGSSTISLLTNIYFLLPSLLFTHATFGNYISLFK